jgi:methylenetetrahydrofolate reductase (NADPH)
VTVLEHIARATEPLVSYEIIPPKRGANVADVLGLIEELAPLEPPFIDVTSHAAQVYYDERPDGTIRRHVRRKRPGTLGLCAAIQGRFGIDAVPHLLCTGFTREETEDALIELNFLGIQNVMALRGDETPAEQRIKPDRTRNTCAAELVGQIAAMNRGEYLEEMLDAEATDFCVGVAGYPEKHFAAPNAAWCVSSLKDKVDAGAQYVVTQMFFDNRHYIDFVERCRAAGIDVPIIPGLKILSSTRQLTSLPKTFHIDLPEELVDRIERAHPDRVAEVGVEWATRQSRELLEAGAPGLHFYIMQRADRVKQVVEAIRA